MKNYLDIVRIMMLILLTSFSAVSASAIEVDNKNIVASGKYLFRIGGGPASGEAWIVGMRGGILSKEKCRFRVR